MKKLIVIGLTVLALLSGCGASKDKSTDLTVKVSGAKTEEITLAAKEAVEFEAETVNGKGEKFSAVYTGFALSELIGNVEYTTVKAICIDGFEAIYTKEEIEVGDIMVVLSKDGEVITDEEEKPTMQILALKDANMKRCVRMIAELVVE